MYCTKCGKKIGENEAFCRYCGAPQTADHGRGGEIVLRYENMPEKVSNEKNITSKAVSDDDTVIRKKNLLPFLLGGIAAVVVLMILVLAVTGIAVITSPQFKYDRQLSLGQRHLDELDYDRAIAAYRAAIEIDPKKPDAYEAMAEVYMEMEEPEKAMEVLQEGIDETGDKKLEKLLAEAEEQTVSVLVSDVEDNEDISAGNDDNGSESAETSDADENETDNTETDVADAGVGAYTRDGNYVIFGSYEQDGDSSNGPEPIEWEVIDENDGEMLLISHYILDSKPYNTEQTDVTWETCTLRKWLNNDFYNTAFSAGEQNMIITTTLSNNDNAYFGTAGGNDTEDKVFILSLDEVMDYYYINSWHDGLYGFSQGLLAPVSEYTMNNEQYIQNHNTVDEDWYYGYGSEGVGDDGWGGLVSEGYSADVIGTPCGSWMLRSPGESSSRNCSVYFIGRIGWDCDGFVDDIYDIGIRPALYLTK